LSQEKPTKKELISEAKGLFEKNGSKPMSRDWFRTHSKFGNRWSDCFSTFKDFMVAAGMPSAGRPPKPPKPPKPEIPIEKQVEIEREKVRSKSEAWQHKFGYLSKEYEALERKLQTVLELATKTPQKIDIQPKLPSGTSESAAIIVASDWHTEERVLPDDVGGANKFDLDIAKERAVRLFQGGHRLWEICNRDTRIATIVLALLGDFITNTLHEDAQESNHLLPADAIWYAQNLIYNGVKFLLKETDVEEIIVPCHVGNHGRMTKKQRHGRVEAGNSLEHYMYRNLQAQLVNEPRVRFLIAEGYHSYLNLFGSYPIRFHHGHSIQYHGGVGGITIPVNKAINEWNKNQHVKLDCFGHFHQYMDGGNFIANGSLVGYNAYAVSIKAAYERPQQAFFLVNKKYNAKTITAPIFLTDEG
jgi:hypothetical protein